MMLHQAVRFIELDKKLQRLALAADRAEQDGDQDKALIFDKKFIETLREMEMAK